MFASLLQEVGNKPVRCDENNQLNDPVLDHLQTDQSVMVIRLLFLLSGLFDVKEHVDNNQE